MFEGVTAQLQTHELATDLNVVVCTWIPPLSLSEFMVSLTAVRGSLVYGTVKLFLTCLTDFKRLSVLHIMTIVVQIVIVNC